MKMEENEKKLEENEKKMEEYQTTIDLMKDDLTNNMPQVGQ